MLLFWLISSNPPPLYTVSNVVLFSLLSLSFSLDLSHLRARVRADFQDDLLQVSRRHCRYNGLVRLRGAEHEKGLSHGHESHRRAQALQTRKRQGVLRS